MQNIEEFTETLLQRELSNEYQHDRVWMVFKDLCVFVLLTKVSSALDGLNSKVGDVTPCFWSVQNIYDMFEDEIKYYLKMKKMFVLYYTSRQHF